MKFEAQQADGSAMNIAKKVKDGAIYATVTRADGRVENLSVVSFYSRNWIKHYAVNAWIFVRDKWRAFRAPK